MRKNNQTLTETVEYIQHRTRASNRRARRAALRCFHDAAWCYHAFGIELYSRLHDDHTGE